MRIYPAWPFLSDPNHPFLSALWAVMIHGADVLMRSPSRSRHDVLPAG